MLCITTCSGFAWNRKRGIHDDHGSGAFMMTTMKYSYVFIPAGVIGVGLGYFLYFREKKKNAACGCPMPAGKLNLTILIFATIVVVLSVVFNVFPGLIAQLFEG
jgi:hypothetical protein